MVLLKGNLTNQRACRHLNASVSLLSTKRNWPIFAALVMHWPHQTHGRSRKLVSGRQRSREEAIGFRWNILKCVYLAPIFHPEIS